jgi:hypothetical protein
MGGWRIGDYARILQRGWAVGLFLAERRHRNFNFGPHLKSKMKQGSAHQYSSHHAELLKTQDSLKKTNKTKFNF